MKLPFLMRKSSSQNPSEDSIEAILAKLTTLLPQTVAVPSVPPRCLLLDVSGSMSGECEPGLKKIDALRTLVAKLPAASTYVFATDVRSVESFAIPHPNGGTNLAGAFDHLKREGRQSAILITDGLPDDQNRALQSALGLSLEIFYVGPRPRPDFLDRLAAATGGRAHAATLNRQGSEQLEVQIRGLLS